MMTYIFSTCAVICSLSGLILALQGGDIGLSLLGLIIALLALLTSGEK